MSNFCNYKIVRSCEFHIETHLRTPYFLFVDSNKNLRTHSSFKVRSIRIREQEVKIEELPINIRRNFRYLFGISLL